MESAHDVMTVIYDALLFCDQGWVRTMNLKCIYFRNDRKRYEHRWLSEMVRSCVNTRCDVIENVETFDSILSYSRDKTYMTISAKEHGNYRATRPSFSADFMRITTISQSSCGTPANVRDPFKATVAKQVPMLSQRLFQNLKFSYMNFKTFIAMVYNVDTPARHLRNETWKCPKLNQNGVINIWVTPRRCGCFVTWFSYQMIAKPGNKTAAPSWPD